MDEYISREAVIDLLKEMRKDGKAIPWEGKNVFSALRNLPAADVRPVVRGKWGYRWKFHGDGRRPTELFPCSECGYDNASATNFCPNCGADMREDHDGI